MTPRTPADGRSLVVVPTYNEAANVAALVVATLRVSDTLDMLFVDDNSPDGTGQILEGIAAHHDRVHVIHGTRKAGLGRAYVSGFRWALARDYAYVVEMDADFSHNPADIQGLLRTTQRSDVTLGSRYLGGTRVVNWPRWRLFLSRGAAFYVRWVTGLPASDPTGGFRCYRRAVLETLALHDIRSDGYAFQVELAHQAWRHGFHVVDYPITFEERRAGASKMSWAIVIEATWMVGALLQRSGFQRRPGSVNPRSIAATPSV